MKSKNATFPIHKSQNEKEKWHEIEKCRALVETQVDFMVALIMAWIQREMSKAR